MTNTLTNDESFLFDEAINDLENVASLIQSLNDQGLQLGYSVDHVFFKANVFAIEHLQYLVIRLQAARSGSPVVDSGACAAAATGESEALPVGNTGITSKPITEGRTE